MYVSSGTFGGGGNQSKEFSKKKEASFEMIWQESKPNPKMYYELFFLSFSPKFCQYHYFKDMVKFWLSLCAQENKTQTKSREFHFISSISMDVFIACNQDPASRWLEDELWDGFLKSTTFATMWEDTKVSLEVEVIR